MILLDMEIPENCWGCPMQRYAVRSDKYICVITGKFAGEVEERSAFCPIKAEIPTGSTNGDVIKAMFPQFDVNEEWKATRHFEFKSKACIEITGIATSEWWNAPWSWKGQKDADI